MVEKDNADLKKANAAHAERELLHGFLARIRDHIRRFRDCISAELGFSSWQELVYALQDEDDAADMAEHGSSEHSSEQEPKPLKNSRKCLPNMA